MSKILVVYYSSYGTNLEMAQVAAEAARAAGAEVRLRRFPETVPQSVIDGQDAWKAKQTKESELGIEDVGHEDFSWADGYFFSVPTRFGGMPVQARATIDSMGGLWAQGELSNKTFTASTSASNPHAGQEATILSLFVMAAHWGTIIVPPGFTDESVGPAGGNPYGTSVTAGQPLGDEHQAAIAHQARRLVNTTDKIKS